MRKSVRLALALPVIGSVALLVGPPTVHGQEISLTEAKGLGLSQKWQKAPGLVTKGPDGKVTFLFGQTQPSVICSPLQVCDIELEPGEVVRDVLVGDSVRWKVEPATSGASAGQSIHLIVKPAEPDLSTSMIVTTSRRTYHVQLKSHPSQYMARVGFAYPDDVSAKLDGINARLGSRAQAMDGSPERLDFSYSISGRAPWRPKRVYSDGEKTYIQFPRSIAGRDAPVLFVVSAGQKRIVNYRMKDDLMVVDYNFDRALLIAGVGWRQQKITINRGR
jgi:type IV secretion system protein VirB9